MKTRDEFGRYVRAIYQPGGAGGENHPSTEQLLEYVNGSSDDAEGVERHVAGCDRCSAALVDLDDFFAPPRDGEAEVSENEAARAWKSLSRRLPSRRAASAGEFPYSALALAASVVIAVGLGAAALQLQRENRGLESLLSTQALRVEELVAENRRLEETGSRLESELSKSREPESNALIVDLFSRNFLQRAGSDSGPAQNQLPSWSGSYVLVLSGEGRSFDASPVLDILDDQGNVVWRGEELAPDPQGNFVITLDGSFLAEGEYRFVLYRKRGDELTRAAEYAVRVRRD